MICEFYLNIQIQLDLRVCFVNEEKRMIGRLSHLAPDSPNFQRRNQKSWILEAIG